MKGLLLVLIAFTMNCVNQKDTSLAEELLNAENLSRRVFIEEAVKLWEYKPDVQVVKDFDHKPSINIMFTDFCVEAKEESLKLICMTVIANKDLVGACLPSSNGGGYVMVKKTLFFTMDREAKLKTLAHEIGHCLGHMEHSNSSYDIMYRSLVKTNGSRVVISSDEKGRLWNKSLGKGSSVRISLLKE